MWDRERTQKLIGRRLKKLRQNYGEDGLTQSELADKFAKLGHPRTQGYLSEVESGKSSMSMDDLITFMNLYQVNPNQLFGLAADSRDYGSDGLSELHQLMDDVSPARRRLYMALVRLLVENESEERKKNNDRLQALLQTAQLFGDDVVNEISDLVGVEFDVPTATASGQAGRKQRADEIFDLTEGSSLIAGR